jgi:hypothetical protein
VFEDLANHVRGLANLPDRRVSLAPASAGAWEKEIYPALREDKEGLAGALVARGSAMVLRLALLYYLLSPPTKGASRGIGPQHMAAALAVWTYCEESARLLFSGRCGTFLGDKLLGLLSAGTMTRDELNNHLSNKQKVEAGVELNRLLGAGLVRQKMVSTGGRPRTVWELAR